MRAGDRELTAKGCVVQVVPHLLPGGFKAEFDACLVVVREVHPWGVKGYVPVPHSDGSTTAPLILKWENIELVGRCPFVRQDGDV